MWTCPECRSVNQRGAKACENCGAERPRTRAAGPLAFPNLTCAWRSGPPCPMPASWFPRGGDNPGVCTWHREVEKNPRRNTFEEFAVFVNWHKQRYCGPLSHHPPGALWDFINRAAAALPKPTRCGLANCRYSAAEATDESVRAFREAVRGGRWELAVGRTLEQRNVPSAKPLHARLGALAASGA